MNHAPAVQYPVGRSVWALRLQAGCLVLWGLVQGLWWLAQDGNWPPGAWWFATTIWVLSAIWAGWRAQNPLLGELHWEPPAPGRKGVSGVWRWFSPAYQQGVALECPVRVLDAQSCMLLKSRTAAGLTLWLWLEADAEPDAWPGLRRAVQSQRA